MAVPQRLAFLPGAIVVAEVDPLAERRMAGLPQTISDVRARDAQVLLLQLDESGRRRVVVPRDLQPETVGFVFDCGARRPARPAR